MALKELKSGYNYYCGEYISKFCEKHELDFDGWTGNTIGGIACCGDCYFNFQDIVWDINSEQPKGLILEWYWDTLDNPKKSINYYSFSKGLRYSDISNEKKDVILWIDDIRNPFINTEGKVPAGSDNIEWVLNYEQFVQWIEKFGLPKIISFDHDLADEHYTPKEYWDNYEESKKYQESKEYKEKTGVDSAKYLVDYCLDNSCELPVFHVHSENPVGADNIRSILNNFNKICNFKK